MNYGIKIVLEAGNVISKEDIATNIGTTIIVTNLFFNTPLRYNFLKKYYTDYCYLRRSMVDFKLLKRTDDGSEYFFDKSVLD